MYLKDLVDYSKKPTGPQELDPNMMSPLFTDLDPAGLAQARDEDGNPISELEAGMKVLMTQFSSRPSQRSRGSSGVQMPGQSISTDQLMKAQPEGDFKLTRSAYLAFLEQCRNGDLTYVRMRKNKLGRQTNVIFYGANFSDDTVFQAKNLYKALNVAKPDLVMVQLSPELLLSDFKQRPERFNRQRQAWEFQPLAYLN